MATTEASGETLAKTITENDIVLVDFWASWCGPCRTFGPIYERASEEHGDIVFAKVDTEAEQQLAGALGIMSIPTLMIFKDGQMASRQIGAAPKQKLEQWITTAV